MQLSDAQRKHLRRLAHDRKTIVQTGSNGVTEAVIKELSGALAHHELVKVKVVAGDREERDILIDRLAEQTGAVLVQRVGHVATLFRRNEEKPRIELPRR